MLHRTKKKVKPIISKINKENKLYRDEVRIRVHNRRTIRGACMICATSSWRPFTQQHGTSADVWVTSVLFPKRDSTLGKCFSFFCFPWTFACPFFFHRKATAVWTDVDAHSSCGPANASRINTACCTENSIPGILRPSCRWAPVGRSISVSSCWRPLCWEFSGTDEKSSV